MKQAASDALAGLVCDEERRNDYILPLACDKRIGPAVAAAVAKAARDSGVARL
jgi:malate dehydrogenase (oxaloacetate-decarboxylating)